MFHFTPPHKHGMAIVDAMKGLIDGKVNAFVLLGGNLLRAAMFCHRLIITTRCRKPRRQNPFPYASRQRRAKLVSTNCATIDANASSAMIFARWAQLARPGKKVIPL